jgi:hypothetical protein
MTGGRKLREEGEHGMSPLKKMKAPQPTIFTQKKQKNYRNDGKGTHGFVLMAGCLLVVVVDEIA